MLPEMTVSSLFLFFSFSSRATRHFPAHAVIIVLWPFFSGLRLAPLHDYYPLIFQGFNSFVAVGKLLALHI